MEHTPAKRELFLPKGSFKCMTYDTGLSGEERVASLFQPDTLLPAQYLETFRRKAPLEPETRLMLGVLEDAVACFQKYLLARDGKGKAMFREAEEWVMEEDSDWLFSFESVCEVLGFDPQYVRQGLVRWKQSKLVERPKAKIYRLHPPVKREKRMVKLSLEAGLRLRKAVSL